MSDDRPKIPRSPEDDYSDDILAQRQGSSRHRPGSN